MIGQCIDKTQMTLKVKADTLSGLAILNAQITSPP